MMLISLEYSAIIVAFVMLKLLYYLYRIPAFSILNSMILVCLHSRLQIEHVQKALDYNSPSWGLKLHSKYKVKQKQSKAEPRGAELSQAEPS